MRLTRLTTMVFIASLGWGGAPRALDLYDWIAVAPIVATGSVLRYDGKYTEVSLERVLRGKLEPGATIRVNTRAANQDRNSHETRLKLKTEVPYLLLLQQPSSARKQRSDYLLVRGVRGAREVPAEGDTAYLTALQRFVSIQDRKDEVWTWTEFGRMLGETNPLLLETALGQFLKFRRGDSATLRDVRPLLDHPSQSLRELAARLIGQLLERRAGGVDSVPSVLGELAASARRDPAVPVRVAATVALNRVERGAVEEILEEIAESDPDQTVRYTAQRLIYERRTEATGEEGSD